jgi:phage shock protein PspC (stress-responsive transcriptional regulator)
MKKIININLAGRLIPIEDTAYDILQAYIESLRKYFATEEGRDEIMSDIESRIAELFQDKIKKGAHCITDTDVAEIMASIGRPQDFDEQEEATAPNGSSTTGTQQREYSDNPNKRLYRNGNDKILGGVCSGLANYFNLDPAIIRILFVLFFFAIGSGFLIYILLWIFIPEKQLNTDNIRKRLYRNPEEKVIGGVCSGLAAYFNIDVWIPRLIFVSPFILSIIFGIIRSSWWWGWDTFPFFISGSFGSTLFITYIILWIVLPVANTTYEKLEMRGEKVDLNTIKNTVKEELESFKKRGGDIRENVQKMGAEASEKVKQWGSEVKQFAETRGAQFASDVSQAARPAASGLGHAIGVLFKSFFLFIAGVIVFALVIALIALFGSGVGLMPFKYFFLDGFWENLSAWGTLIFFIAVPILGLVTSLIRRIVGIKSRNKYLGYIFGGLWVIGWVCVVMLVSSFSRNVSKRQYVTDTLAISQPMSNKMLVKVDLNARPAGGSNTWINMRGAGILDINDSAMLVKYIRPQIIKSEDDKFHVYLVKFAQGNTQEQAYKYASEINYPVGLQDSTLKLGRYFEIKSGSKFRFQRVLVVIEVPVGKQIRIDRSVRTFRWFDVQIRHNVWNDNGDDYDNEDYNYPWYEKGNYWQWNEDYIMDEKGKLQNVNKPKNTNGNTNDGTNETDGGYRYPGNNSDKSDTINNRRDSLQKKQPADRTVPEKTVNPQAADNNAGNGTEEEPVNNDESLLSVAMIKFIE